MKGELRIRTPEGVMFAYALAGPVTRCLAATIDLICAIILSTFLGRLLGLAGWIDEGLAQALIVLGYFVISIGYGVLMEWAFRGQTLGKRMLRLRVIDAGGLRLRFYQVLLRNLLRFVDMLPAFYLLGGVLSLFNARAQRLGDLAAGTIVVHQPKLREPDLEQLLAVKFNSLREHPHLAARLRQRVTPEAAGAVLQALLRRDQLTPDSRVALYSEMASYFKALVSFPSENFESMPDEQCLRNLAEILFSSGRVAKRETGGDKRENEILFDTPESLATLPARFSDKRVAKDA